MAIRMPLKTIVLHRDGRRIEVKPGAPFEFNDDEIKELRGKFAIRHLNDESNALPTAPASGPVADDGAKDQIKADAKPTADASDL